MSRQEVTIDNPKAHFILNDSLCNLSLDINFSIFRKYTCKAGCNICYIRKDWLDDSAFKKHIPIKIESKSYGDRLVNLSKYFGAVTTIDDLRFVRDQHPELYRFYQEHSDLFLLGSMTDNAIFRHLPIFRNDEVRFIGVRDISISEFFLARVNLNKLFNALSLINSKARIYKIKVILAQDSLKPEASKELARWCQLYDVVLEKQFEYGADGKTSTSVLTDIHDARYNEVTGFSESVTYNEQLTEIFPIHSESIFLMYDWFFSELKSATRDDRSTAFATIADFDDPVKFLAKVVEGKVTDYRRYLELIQNKDNVYFKYFNYVVNHIVVHHDFNFIPKVGFNPYSTYYRQLVKSGVMNDNAYGLIVPNTETVIPIYSFRDHEPIDIQNRENRRAVSL